MMLYLDSYLVSSKRKQNSQNETDSSNQSQHPFVHLHGDLMQDTIKKFKLIITITKLYQVHFIGPLLPKLRTCLSISITFPLGMHVKI